MITIQQISERFKETELRGNASAAINDVIQLDPANTREDVLYWCSDKNLGQLAHCKAGTVICSEKARSVSLPGNCNYLFTKNPRQLFSQVLKEFFMPKPSGDYISSRASIHPSAKMGRHVFIGDFTVIAGLRDRGPLFCIRRGGRRIPARSGRAAVPRTDVPSSRAFIPSTLSALHRHLPWLSAAGLITARRAQPRKTYSEIP